ncbi:MAG: bifunctional 3'-5' exonuclease/DNA polymerase, partial [Pseudoclavibacter sp.]
MTGEAGPPLAPLTIAIGRDDEGYWMRVVDVPAEGSLSAPGNSGIVRATGSGAGRFTDAASLASAVAAAEREAPTPPRWVLDGAALPELLLRHGVRVDRCHDLGLVGRILATRGDAAERLRVGAAATAAPDQPEPAAPPPAADAAALFDLDEAGGPAGSGATPDEAIARYRHQLDVIDRARDGGALRLLAAAESAGRIVAAELGSAGVPFDVERHERLLIETLGERGPTGRPVKLEAAAVVVREALGAPRLHVDSHRDLLAALRAAGLPVRSTSAWELNDHEHPVIAPLQHYKHLSRLFTANGWSWRDDWVRGGRMRTGYVPGGVVTGRWATSGGGALQLPREVRAAVVADPGWKLIVADAAQLEPRILAALSGDERMARAGQARDLYQAFVDAGVVPTRGDAKLGLLGAMYGGTRGRSGELLPALQRAYPQALRFVETAARAGERGEQVVTRLGRFSPWPPDHDAGEGGGGSGSPDATGARAGGAGSSAQAARNWGRFTRNFVVQGTAAEWALAWLARIRQRVTLLGTGAGADAGAVAGASKRLVDVPLTGAPHLVYFLHDEIVVHAPAAVADEAAREVEAAAAWAGRLLFPDAPVAFPVTAAVVDVYADA